MKNLRKKLFFSADTYPSQPIPTTNHPYPHHKYRSGNELPLDDAAAAPSAIARTTPGPPDLLNQNGYELEYRYEQMTIKQRTFCKTNQLNPEVFFTAWKPLRLVKGR